VIGSQLPNVQLAAIPREKITDYLLASSHAAGYAKAGFFQRFGFTAAGSPILRDALLQHARLAAVATVADTAFGRKYILERPLSAPDGRAPLVWAVWFIEAGTMRPRLVTAYPLPGIRP
jgi:hypothetical protein